MWAIPKKSDTHSNVSGTCSLPLEDRFLEKHSENSFNPKMVGIKKLMVPSENAQDLSNECHI
jgi:hypothetical protein